MHINFELADKYPCVTYKVRVRYTNLREQLEPQISFCDHRHKGSI